MTESVKFNAELKNTTGKGNSRALRLAGRLPAIIYGDNQAPQMMTLSYKDFFKEYSKGGIRTRPVEIVAGNETINVITKDIQIHPVSDNPLHIDFLRVGLNTLINIAVNIRVINEDKSPGMKKGGIANLVNRTVLLHCHPSDIPHHIDIDLTDLEIGHNIHINDIKLPSGVHPVDKSNFTLVTIIGRTEDEDKVAGPADATATATTTAA